MKNKIQIIIAITLGTLFAGCGPIGLRPVNVPDIKEIKNNQTAFVVPLEGATKSNQRGFDSIEFLEASKVATKRIEIAKRWRQTGRFWRQGEWIPVAKIITVSRTPVTREWKPTEEIKKNGKIKISGGQGIEVESRDSIGFAVGINITAQILEPDTAKYLYYYPGKDLSSVMDSNIRGDIQSSLSREFGKRSLEECKIEKNVAFESVKQQIIDKYKGYGITITSFGLAGGLWYEDQEIQDAINQAYTAEMKIKQKEQDKLAQEQENMRLLSIAENQRQQAEEFAKAAEARKKQVEAEVEMIRAEAFAEAVKKWDGALPKFMTGGQDSNMLFQVSSN